MSKTSSKSVSKAVPKKKNTAAVKSQTVAKKTVKTPKTKSVKTKTTVKKSPVNKAIKPTRKASKRKVSEKATPRKTTTKKESAPIKKTSTQAASKKVATKESSVTLPTRMSIRAREKALVLAEFFETDFYPAGLTLARYGGLCFVLLGGLATLGHLSSGQLAEPCVDNGCQAAQVGGALDGANPVLVDTTYLEVLSFVPGVITDVTSIPLEITSVSTVEAHLLYINDNGSGRQAIPVTDIGNKKYEITIDPDTLPATQYELVVTVTHTGQTQPVQYSIGVFDVEFESDSNEAQQTETGISTPSVPAASTTSVASTSQVTTENDSVVQLNLNSGSVGYDLSSIEPEKTPVETKPNLVPEVIKEVAKEVESKHISVSVPSTVRGAATIEVANADRNSQVFFYLRKIQGLQAQRIGILVSGRDTFTFNSRLFPNGQYQFYAEATFDGNKVQSNKVDLRIANELTQVEKTPATSSVPREVFTLPPKQEIESEPPRISSVEREIVERPVITEPIDRNITPFDGTVPLQNRLQGMIATDSDEINDLLQKYAIAQQSGDEVLQAEAKRAIRLYRERVISEALADRRDRSVADELDQLLAAELEQLQQKVRTFETLRKERSDSESAQDTDGDGISDIDEVTLYNTDPLQADTDNDGFTDGVEIMRGFDPTNAEIEAVIAYQSPREVVGVVTTKELAVSEIVPNVNLTNPEEKEVVQAVVRGRGLPNSFVTLYVFSTPTIVTVRTESDGTFEYTFSKELEDGEHQVFVALTDNTGAIVAQSEPFTFIKEAQAFTPVDAQEVVAGLNQADNTNVTTPYQLVLGMSVFALGVLLILLGVGLRSNKPEIIITENKLV